MKENFNKHKGLYNNLLWIFFISIILLSLGEYIGQLLLPDFEINQSYWFTFMQYFSFIGIWISTLLTIFIFKKNHFIKHFIGNKFKGNKVSYIFIGLALGFFLNGFCALIAFLHGDFSLEFNKFEFIPALGLFIAVFIQSSAEEVLCRGFLYQRLLKSITNPWFAIIVNSLFFAGLHLLNDGITFLAFYDLFITGVLFSMLVYYFDSLWMAMGAHASWNFTQSILLGLPNSGSSFPYSIFKINSVESINSFAYDKGFGLEGTILSSLLITLVCIILYVWKNKKKCQDLKEDKRDFEN